MITLILCFILCSTPTANYYANPGVICEDNAFVDDSGELWDCNSTGLCIDDEVVAIMCDNGTPDYIYDDDIIGVIKCD